MVTPIGTSSVLYTWSLLCFRRPSEEKEAVAASAVYQCALQFFVAFMLSQESCVLSDVLFLEFWLYWVTGRVNPTAQHHLLGEE